MRRIFLLVIPLILFPIHSHAASGSGTEAASFLDIPVGAGPAALGAAYTALAQDAYAPVWNPGGLGFLENSQLAGQHLSYLESIHYEFLSFVHPLAHGRSLGASAQYLGSGDIAGTNKDGDSIGDFSTHFAAYSVALGQAFGNKLSLGVTGKIIDAKIADVSAQAYAADIGAMFKANDRLTLGAVVTNIGTALKFLDDGGPLPLAFKWGAAYKPASHWTMAAEGVYRKTGLASGHVGIEWKPIPMIAIRAGYRTDIIKELSAMAGLTTGVGLHVWGQELAYAWVPYGELGSTQYFSLLLRFGQAEEAKRNLIQYQNIRSHRTAKDAKDLQSRDPEYQQLMQLLSDQDREFYARRSRVGTEDLP